MGGCLGTDGGAANRDHDAYVCSEKGLTELVLPAKRDHASLRTLDANDNQIVSIGQELASCRNLESLLLYKNEIKTVGPEICGANLPALKVLNLFNNKLRKVPDSIGTLASLEEANLAANKLMVLSDGVCVGWKSVKVLSLFDNNLVMMGSLAPLVTLEELRLYGNNLEAMPELPQPAAALTTLEIHKNRITTVPGDYFDATPALTALSIWANSITRLPDSVCRCGRLEQLKANDNKICALPDGPWPASLETLFLSDNPGLKKLPKKLAEQLSGLKRCAARARGRPSGRPAHTHAMAILFACPHRLTPPLLHCAPHRLDVAKLPLDARAKAVAEELRLQCLRKGGFYRGVDGKRQEM